nr:unnamed protein product [Callosobruchus chinensis]
MRLPKRIKCSPNDQCGRDLSLFGLFVSFAVVVCDRRHEVYESKWFAFRRLAFLLDRDEPTQAINSIEGDKDDEEEIEETDISEVAGPEIDTLELQH